MKNSWPYINPVNPDIYKERTNWPKISIITPSYNQGQYIEETILSVLNQNYPNLEYIIIDGGSIDNTVEIIKKYEGGITYWISEKDNGQAHAINKGFTKATGEILTWLNSDDYYCSNALYNMAHTFLSEPNYAFYQGHVNIIDDNGNFKYTMYSKAFNNKNNFLDEVCMPQPASFFTRNCFEQFGPLDEQLTYTMDMDFWLKIHASRGHFYESNAILTNFRTHENTKSAKGNIYFIDELFRKYTLKNFTEKEKKSLTENFIKKTQNELSILLVKQGSLKQSLFYKNLLKLFFTQPFFTTYLVIMKIKNLFTNR